MRFTANTLIDVGQNNLNYMADLNNLKKWVILS